MSDLTVSGQHQEAQRDVARQDLPSALARSRRVLATYPRHIGTYAVLGQIYLELGRHEDAANLFRRVLSADPEHTISYASLGVIYEARGLLDEAIWQFERALELSPRNAEVRAELRRLYDQRAPELRIRPALTRGALARIYLRAQLYPKAIGELRDLVAAEPHRVDLRVALAEALWHDHRIVDAEAVSQGILAELPNCLKANLILGRIWLHTDRDEDARTLLQRAQALDPENAVARALFGDESPLPVRVARLPLLATEDDEPVDRPYLVDDEEIVVSSQIIDADVRPPSSSIMDWGSLDERALKVLGIAAPSYAPTGANEVLVTPEPAPEPPETDQAPPEALSPSAPDARVAAMPEPPIANEALPETVLEGAEPECPDGHSLLDMQRLRVQRDPDDLAERLRLARLYGALGEFDEAILHYQHLLRERRALSEIDRDLSILHMLCPGHEGLTALLLQVRYGFVKTA